MKREGTEEAELAENHPGEPGALPIIMGSFTSCVSFTRQCLLLVYFRAEEGDGKGQHTAQHVIDATCCDSCTFGWPRTP